MTLAEIFSRAFGKVGNGVKIIPNVSQLFFDKELPELNEAA